jgi:hypothetical protein
VDPPAAVEGDPGGYQHQDSTKVIHARASLSFYMLNPQMNRATV